MKQNKISVIIPTFNRRKVVWTAVDSVLGQKNHGWDFEIIVSDDGSSDQTFKTFESNQNPKIKYFFSKKNKGVNAARNKGIKEASGEYVLFLDSDDSLKEDAFSILEEYRKKNKLDEINFFGTQEIESGKKMFFLEKEKKISYKEWLEGKKISGEFISFFRADVLKKNLFDEKRFCFEQFHWNKLIKMHGLFASKKIIRLYSFGEENRVSKKLIEPKNALKRFQDYKDYIEEFKGDYLKFNLHKKFAEILFKTGFYGLLAWKPKEGRDFLKKSLNYHFSAVVLCSLLFSFSGKKLFLAAYRTVQKMKKN